MPNPPEETERIAGPVPILEVPSVTLVVIDGPSRGKKARLGNEPTRVGAAEGCGLWIDDRRVSRVHLELRVGADAITCRDLGSLNGTFIDGVRIRDADVPPGTTLRLGDSAVRVEVESAPTVIAVSPRTSFGDLLGSSLSMRLVYTVLERAAPTEATLLLLGETGTGKDVAARAVHGASPRRDGPFVPVDCGAIPESLVESELFGHVRGAFTGAVAARKGAFEEADGGTLFLDEIGEMPLAVQPKLLRAIETRTIRRVGESVTKPINVRIVAATNRPLAEAVNRGAFREDLYYRLAVIEVALPPLRARRGDIALLATRFHERLAGPGEKPSPELVASLESRSWPGNVRELRNVIERAFTLNAVSNAAGGGTTAARLPEGIEAIMPLHMPLKEARAAWTAAFDGAYVRAMLDRAGGNLTHAAAAAGVSRRFLQRLVARMGSHAGAADPEDDDGADQDDEGESPAR